MTFFAWGDTHFGFEPGFVTTDFRAGIIEQMNRLPGWPYPSDVWGCVAKPEFVMHCGDWLDSTLSGSTEMAIFRHFLAALRFPHHVTQGNHDLDPAAVDWLLATHGQAGYAFTAGGFRCLSLTATYDAGETSSLDAASLALLERETQATDASQPVVLFSHSPLRCQANAAAAAERVRGRPIALAVAAHKHRPAFYRWEGIPCIDLGHCRNHPNDSEAGRSFTVVQLTRERVRALPWRWDLSDWDRRQRWTPIPDPEARQPMRLDTPLREGLEPT